MRSGWTPTWKVSEPRPSLLVELDVIREAQERLRPVAIRTPLYRADVLNGELGCDIRLKLESLQRAGSFKFRGAYNFVAQLPDGVRSRGVITYSSGNHAQAVALAAQLHGVRAVVVMPITVPQIKRDGAEQWGAEVVLEGTTSLERKARAESIAEEQGLVSPYSRAVFEAYWGDLLDVSQDEVLRPVVESVGLDWGELKAKIDAPEYKLKLRTNTDELIERGGFGSPTMFVDGDDMYFGNDRLRLLTAALAA